MKQNQPPPLSNPPINAQITEALWCFNFLCHDIFLRESTVPFYKN